VLTALYSVRRERLFCEQRSCPELPARARHRRGQTLLPRSR
jgi:hypothetical protein